MSDDTTGSLGNPPSSATEEMPADFKGLLQSRHEQSRALRVSIAFFDQTVELSSDLGFIGKWSSEDVGVERSADNWFKLTLDQEEWDFLADDPTGFFLAAPLPPPGQVRTRDAARSSRLSEVSKGAVGAMLAVFLLSLGIVVGRNRIDGSPLVVTIMLILAAASGLWWATLETQRREHTERSRRPGPALRTDRPQTALRVEDVMRKREAQAPASAHSSPAAPEVPDGRTEPSAVDTELSKHAPDADSTRDQAPSTASQTDPLGDEPAEEPTHDHDIDSGWIDVAIAADDDEVHARAAVDGRRPHADGDTAAHEEREGSLLPTAAVKRYLAALSRMTEADSEAIDSEPTAIEATVPESNGAQPDKESTMELTDIRGIGPALSNALSSLGVTDVHDLAELDSGDLDFLEEQLGRFGSRIRSERWVEQARQMVRDR